MKMLPTPNVFHAYSPCIAMCTLLFLYMLSHECNWQFTSLCQTKKTNKNKTFLFMQDTGGTTVAKRV